ncbi:MAG: GIY-YIG nuclease family protein [Burkholderiales bacterium]|nr:GIY-YIG nuclease family protein [Burkholderiales bacterium]
MEERTYYVYLLASKSRRLYVGVTNSLERRLFEHREKLVDGFTKQYNIDRLVYFEQTPDVLSAICREKQIKRWRRSKKISLIESKNPTWEDLSTEWYKDDRK